MLSSLLSSHDQVICFFELFHRHLKSVPFSVAGYRSKANHPRIVHLRNTDPVGFLKSEVYKPQRDKIKAVGFKLLYPQGRKGVPWWNEPEFNRWWENVGYEPNWDCAKSDLWQFLKEDTSIAIIHLKRENLLRSKVSAMAAQLTGKWGVGATGGINETMEARFSLKFEECLQDLEAHRRMEDEAEALFANHQKLDLTYEEMVEDLNTASSRVQNFLGLTPKALKTKTIKQESRDLSEIVVNYDNLKKQFSTTCWQYLFEE